MSRVLVAGPDGGGLIQLWPVQIRILEDGTATSHRLGLAEIRLPLGAQGPPQHKGSTSSRAPCGSRPGQRRVMPGRERW